MVKWWPGPERPDSDELVSEAARRFSSPADALRRFRWRGERWLAGQRCFIPGSATSPDAMLPEPNQIKYATLVVTAAMPLEPTRATLHNLLLVLSAASVGILVLGLVAGRFVCRRALRPVRQMADDARTMNPSDPARRIVTPGGPDELTDLGVAFNGLLDRLHETGERHRRFAGDASPRLRTLLTGLMGQIEIALRRERTLDEYRDVLATAHAKAAQLHGIVEALLFLTRARFGRGARPGWEHFDLGTWLSGHLTHWASHPRYGDIHLVGADIPLNVKSSPILLGEIVNVLLDNACRYSPLGSSITLSLSHADRSAQLEIVDQGQGICASDLAAMMFTPFFRTTSALHANKQGVGLGLTIARRLATMPSAVR